MKPDCSICGATGDGAHFGAESCRACAAFFRRSVAMQRNYKCRSGGTCEIQTNVRCMCRSCRFEKCLKAGMKRTAVQRHRDSIGKRPYEMSPKIEVELSNVSPYSKECSISPIAVVSDGMPTLNRMIAAYDRMKCVRKIVHRNQVNVFDPPVPQSVTKQMCTEQNTKELEIVVDFIRNSFDDFNELPCDQQKMLYRNFIVTNMLLECGYQSVVNNRCDIIVLPSGDFIDTTDLERFYQDVNSENRMSPEDAVRLFSPSFDIYRRNVIEPMMAHQVNKVEFFAMCALTLFDHGLPDQSRECEELCYRVRDRVIQELIYYYRYVVGEVDHATRMAKLMILLPALQRAVRRFFEDAELSQVFGVFTGADIFFETIERRFGKIV